jgi:2-polyprenyl-3-methyl-5-hydroxy-6-metoxy-1,4-benzoquinol methylase
MNNTFKVSSELYNPDKNTVSYSDKIDDRVYIVASWLGSKKKVLDVGCYDGWYSEVFLKNDNEVHGIDASSAAIAKANERGIQAKVADLEKAFPYPDNTFDAVFGGEIIEHLYDTDFFVQECFRVLKPGGKLYITTPNVLSLPRRFFFVFGVGMFFEASPTFPVNAVAGHIRYFTKSLLINFISHHGFIFKKFTSNYVNAPFGLRVRWLAKLVPTFGKNLITEFEKPHAD